MQGEHADELRGAVEGVGDRRAGGEGDRRSGLYADQRDQQIAVRDLAGVTSGKAPQRLGVLRTRCANRDPVYVILEGRVVHH